MNDFMALETQYDSLAHLEEADLSNFREKDKDVVEDLQARVSDSCARLNQLVYPDQKQVKLEAFNEKSYIEEFEVTVDLLKQLDKLYKGVRY